MRALQPALEMYFANPLVTDTSQNHTDAKQDFVAASMSHYPLVTGGS